MTAPLTAASLVAPESRLRQAVRVGTVVGGKDTSPLWVSKIASADFAEALRRSLAVHGLLAAASERFRVDAELVELQQPFAGFDFTVTAVVRYRMVSTSSGAVLFATDIRSPFTADFGSSYVAVERLRLANEGAARENLRLFLEALVGEARSNPGRFEPPIAGLIGLLVPGG